MSSSSVDSSPPALVMGEVNEAGSPTDADISGRSSDGGGGDSGSYRQTNGNQSSDIGCDTDASNDLALPNLDVITNVPILGILQPRMPPQQ